MNDPKFQYSVFPNADRNEQYVVRADTIEDLKNQISQLKLSLAGLPLPNTPAPYVAPKVEPDGMQKMQLAQPCRKCGGEMVLNPKTQKVFCKAKCWLGGGQ